MANEKVTPAILDKSNKTESSETYITYKEPIIEYVDGIAVQTYKIHGPILSKDWSAYEKENGL